MRKFGLILALMISVTSTKLWSQPKDVDAKKDRPTQGMMHKHAVKELNLTDEQQKQVDKLHSDLAKELIDQRAKIAKAGVELHDLFKVESPDKSAISKKIQEIADLGAEAKILRVDHWFAVNKILSADQQKVWKKFLNERMEDRFEGGMMKHPGMKGPHSAPMPEMHGGPNIELDDELDGFSTYEDAMSSAIPENIMDMPQLDQPNYQQ